jgi:RNA polymerase sigma factor (sigma-70 family)
MCSSVHVFIERKRKEWRSKMAPTAHDVDEIDAERDLMPLRRSAYRAIQAELRKANLRRCNDIEDIFQDACLNTVGFLRKSHKIENLENFFLTTCRNSARRYMRKAINRERAQGRFPTDLVRAVHGEGYLPLSSLPQARSLILEALLHLTRRERLIIEMIFIEQLSDEEMRQRLKCTPEALRTAKCRALKGLLFAIQEIVRPS